MLAVSCLFSAGRVFASVFLYFDLSLSFLSLLTVVSSWSYTFLVEKEYRMVVDVFG